MYVLRNITEEFIKEFYANLMQRYNGIIVLVKRLKKEYIVYGIHVLA